MTEADLRAAMDAAFDVFANSGTHGFADGGTRKILSDLIVDQFYKWGLIVGKAER